MYLLPISFFLPFLSKLLCCISFTKIEILKFAVKGVFGLVFMKMNETETIFGKKINETYS